MKIKSVCIFLTTLFLSYTTNGLAGDDIHASYDMLLKKYVAEDGVRYEQFHATKSDVKALNKYVKSLENLNPRNMQKAEALAYWINLYNATTLKLILDNYPLESIKDIGGLLSSPWNKKLVKVNGRELTLNQIENEIIRPEFKDARIHFALNCAAVGCPPLTNSAYVGSQLDKQLDEASKNALIHEGWLKVGDSIMVSKIFDWYKQDFVDYSGSVREYIVTFRPDLATIVRDKDKKIEFLEYNWNLNSAGK